MIVRSPQKYIKLSEVEVNQIKNVRWDNVSGGYNRKQSGYSLYGYIPYSLAEQLVDCSGKHEKGYNLAKICIPAKLNDKHPYKDGFRYLKSIAENEKPRIRPKGFPACTKLVLDLLIENKQLMRKEVYEKIEKDIDKQGYEKKTIRNTINNLKRQGKVKVTNNYRLIELIEQPMIK